MKTIGVVGCGTIGQSVIRAVDNGILKVRLAGVTSRSRGRVDAFLPTLRNPPPVLTREELIDRADLIVEAAGPHVVPELARDVFAAAKDLMVVSIGALLDHVELIDLARQSGCRLLLPSGAIAGLDGVKGHCLGRVDFVKITSRKPPHALKGAPFILQHGIALEELKEERVLFTGSARAAVVGFPDNLNVAAALSLAGLGPDATTVSISVVPGLQRNCHEIEVVGEAGSLRVLVENIPTENPKTGRVTAMSVIRALQDAFDCVRIGT